MQGPHKFSCIRVMKVFTSLSLPVIITCLFSLLICYMTLLIIIILFLNNTYTYKHIQIITKLEEIMFLIEGGITFQMLGHNEKFLL